MWTIVSLSCLLFTLICSIHLCNHVCSFVMLFTVTEEDLEVLDISGNALVNEAYEADLDTRERDGRAKKKYGYEAYFFEKYMNRRYFINDVYQQLIQQSEKDHLERKSNEALRLYNQRKDKDNDSSPKSSRDKKHLERTKSREHRDKRHSDRSREYQDKRRLERTSSREDPGRGHSDSKYQDKRRLEPTSSRDDPGRRHSDSKNSREAEDRRRLERTYSKGNHEKKKSERTLSRGGRERRELERTSSRDGRRTSSKDTLGRRTDRDHRKSRSTSRQSSSSSLYDYGDDQADAAKRGSRPKRRPSDSSIDKINDTDSDSDGEREEVGRRAARSNSSRSLSKTGHTLCHRSQATSSIDDLFAESSDEEEEVNRSRCRSSSSLHYSKDGESGKNRRGKLRSMSPVPNPGMMRVLSGTNIRKMASKTNSSRILERSNSQTGSSPDLKGSRSRERSSHDLKRRDSNGIPTKGSSRDLRRVSSRSNVERSCSKSDLGRQSVSRSSSRNFDQERDVLDRRAVGLSRKSSVSGSRRNLLVASNSSRSLASLSRPNPSILGYEHENSVERVCAHGDNLERNNSSGILQKYSSEDATTTGPRPERSASLSNAAAARQLLNKKETSRSAQSSKAPPQRGLIKHGSVGNLLSSTTSRRRGVTRRGSVGNLVQDRQKAQLASATIDAERGMESRGSVVNRMDVQGMQAALLALRTPSNPSLLQDFPGIPPVQDHGYVKDSPGVGGVARDFPGLPIPNETEKSSANTSVTGSVSPSSTEAEVSDFWGAMFQSAEERENTEKRKNEARQRASLAAS